MLSQLEGGEEQWVPDPQDLEERDILRVTYTGKNVEWIFSHGLHPSWSVIITCPSNPSSASGRCKVKSFRNLSLQKQASVAEWFREQALEPNFVDLNSGPYLWDLGKVINLSLGFSSVNYCEI